MQSSGKERIVMQTGEGSILITSTSLFYLLRWLNGEKMKLLHFGEGSIPVTVTFGLLFLSAE